MLIKLGISSSGYYSWKKRKPSDRKKRKAEIKEKIKGKGFYGIITFYLFFQLIKLIKKVLVPELLIFNKFLLRNIKKYVRELVIF